MWTGADPNAYASDAFSNPSRGYAYSDTHGSSRHTHSNAHSHTYPYSYSHTGTQRYPHDFCLCARPLLFLKPFFPSNKRIR